MNTDLLVDFLNTYDEGDDSDEIPDDRAFVAWLRAHGLPAKRAVAAEAHRVRGALRDAIDGRTPPPADLALVPLRATVGAEGLTLGSDHALGPIVATAVRLAHEGAWSRLKLCDASTCRYAFFDGSRNRSGRWCDMAVCGNRAKTRAFRERHGH